MGEAKPKGVGRCPICRRDAKTRPENPFAPFCSERCRLVDLGHWLDEDYRVPGPAAGDDSSDKPPHPRNDGDDD
jgi:endogenous inhibitor of DNA gyrase (YacG/DUF329 family)